MQPGAEHCNKLLKKADKARRAPTTKIGHEMMVVQFVCTNFVLNSLVPVKTSQPGAEH